MGDSTNRKQRLRLELKQRRSQKRFCANSKCGKRYAPYREWQRYCSRPCAALGRTAELIAAGFGSAFPGIVAGTVGTISELAAAADLLSKGYEVFRALTPTSSCDLAILKERKLLRVEVTTGYRSPTGRIHKPKKAPRFDLLAIVIAGKEIIYEPREF